MILIPDNPTRINNNNCSGTSMVRLASINHLGKQKLAAQLSNGYCDISSIALDARAFLAAGEEAQTAANKLIASCSSPDSPLYVSSEECRLLAPLNGSLCGKFLCIGMNYVDHCTEQNVPIPQEPLVFSKFGSCIVGPGDPVAKDELTDKLDYEVELGVVIGSLVPRNTTKQDAMQYVGGYTVVHDVSARDWQLERNGGQWLLGKAIDGYAPIGPVIVTRDEMSDELVHNSGIRCRVNGETLQDSNTDKLVFKVDTLIAFISRFMTLYPGDVIATGTPPGVGCFRNPPKWLVPGDVVECEIDGIGTLVTPIVEPLPKPSEAQLAKPFVTGRLEGMTCIVTGAASFQGIGFGIAARLGLEGASRVAIVDLDPEAVKEACDKLQSVATSCLFTGVACDVSDIDAVTKAWADIAEGNGGRIDILIQAAGIVGATNVKTADVDPENFDAVFRVNVRGIFNGCKAVLPYMTKQGYGRIVNIASIAGKEGNAGMLAYSASKAAVIGLTKTIGKEYAETGVTCNALAPAVVRTQMVEDMPPSQVKYMTDKIPMKRCGTIDEIASMVTFMASPEAAFTTGFCFDATGGRAVY